MKKILSFITVLFFLLSSLSLMSQSLQVYNGSTPLTNGTIIYVWGDTTANGSIDVTYSVKNISSGTVIAKAREIPTSLITGSKVSICFGGTCYAQTSSIFTAPATATIASGATDNSFLGHYFSKDNIGQSIVTFVFFNVSTNDSAWVVVYFNATAAGLNNILASNTNISNAYPNPASDITTFNYTLPGNESKFILRNILGSEVKEINIPNAVGSLTVNTSDLSDGVYFYSFYSDNKLILTRKLMIQH